MKEGEGREIVSEQKSKGGRKGLGIKEGDEKREEKRKRKGM